MEFYQATASIMEEHDPCSSYRLGNSARGDALFPGDQGIALKFVSAL